MDPVSSMEAFVKVVEAGSFSSAARELRIPKSTLSRRITRLEDRLGVQLIKRTTRQLSLTDVGQAYFDRCVRIVSDIHEMEDAVSHMQATPKGALRITAPIQRGGFFAELATTFMKEYPEVELDVFFTNRFVNLIDEGFDVAIRGGVLDDSSLIARKLANTSHVLVASPGYIKKNGEPKTAEDLKQHACLIRNHGHAVWYTKSGQAIAVSGPLRANDVDVVCHAAMQDLGIARLPVGIVCDHLNSGALIPVLEEEMTVKGGLYAVYPANRHLSAKVRAFVDFVSGYLKENPLFGTHEKPC